MATYSGMTLSGEVRESVSLDEDDLSDVEDEVFIRDGKNGYKFAEDVGVKRPLMAPRKKTGRPDITSRIKSKPPCKALCMPCCCILLSLMVVIGLIVLVAIILIAFPLTLDNLRDWLLQEQSEEITIKSLPCNNLKVTDVWTVTLPKFTSESPIRLVDVNQDGVKDVIFGFGTGDDSNLLNSEVFCPIFLGVPFPCKGGVIALNGLDGNILWRMWTNDTIFSVSCTSDVNNDSIMDCLIMGNEGTLGVINSKNGSVIWQINRGRVEIYIGNFIPDQDNDTVDDVLTSHTLLGSDQGYLILLSGKTGNELKRLALSKTFFMPQLIEKSNGSYLVLFGTGSPSMPGNLSVIPLNDILSGNNTAQTLYRDKFSGILTQSVLVDINSDGYTDIIAAMFNSTVVAIDGLTYTQIWNYSVPNTEMLIVPTPAYFNDDNITDFLIICQNPDDSEGNTLTKAFILNGRNGKPIYAKSIDGSVPTQMGALSLSMEGYGLDMFLFWTSECRRTDKSENKVKFSKDTDTQIVTMSMCANLNSSFAFKLNALNQYDQPPGFEIYNSENRSQLEYNNSKTALEEVQFYLKQHPDKQFTLHESSGVRVDIDKVIGNSNERFRKYKNNFKNRQKDNKKGPIQILNENTNRNPVVDPYVLDDQQKFEDDYEQLPENWNSKNPENQLNVLSYGVDQDYNNFLDGTDRTDMFPIKQNRDPRSKTDTKEANNLQSTTTQATTQSNKYGIFDYENVRKARKRLLHDLNNLPTDILRDTYFENRERQLKKSKFEQRDLKSHYDKIKENEELKKVIDQERQSSFNISKSLWDLESEKELEDREHGYWRLKRNVDVKMNRTNKVTSVAAIVDSFNVTNNSIDVIFLTYWVPTRNSPENILNEELEKCVNKKIENGLSEKYHKTTLQEQTSLYMKECAEEFENLKRIFPYFNQVINLSLGQMTVYRLRIECRCKTFKKSERCGKFLPSAEQRWPQHLGNLGNGMVNI